MRLQGNEKFAIPVDKGLAAQPVRNATSDIDFVITWVDGNDPDWLAQKLECLGTSADDRSADTRNVRYRPWDTFRYLFRGIDTYAPWVRKVHLVTWGHLPTWLNAGNPKLNVVKHADYIPEKYLPTFSSRTIEFNFHRIPGLAEKFVNFNDDMMLIKPVKPTDFFYDGLPCDSAVLSPYKVVADDWFYAPVTNIAVINKYFTPHKSMAESPLKWFNLKYGKDLLHTLTMLPYPEFYGFGNYHLPDSFLRSTFEELWEREPELLDSVCSHKFRVRTDPNQWLFQGWQLASGKFHPRSKAIGAYFSITGESDAKVAASYITNRKGKLVCLNDISANSAELVTAERTVMQALDRLLPERSSFELDVP